LNGRGEADDLHGKQTRKKDCFSGSGEKDREGKGSWRIPFLKEGAAVEGETLSERKKVSSGCREESGGSYYLYFLFY